MNLDLDEHQGHALTAIQDSLIETIQWCSAAWSNMEEGIQYLRTTSFQPHALAGSRKSVVDSVRSYRQTRASLSAVRRRVQRLPGRLLAYLPDENLADGAASVATY